MTLSPAPHLRYLSNEIWSLIAGFCEIDSLFVLARTSSRYLCLSVRELKNRCVKDPDYRRVVEAKLSNILTLEAAADSITYLPGLCCGLEYKLCTWDLIKAYPPGVLQRYSNSRLIDYHKVTQDLLVTLEKLKGNTSTTAPALRSLPPLLLYRIWQEVFLQRQGVEVADNETESVKKLPVPKKLISLLTDDVMTLFRETLIINDRFLLKCFEHGLENILLFLYENQQCFKVSITTPKLHDLYIMLACDTECTSMFMRLVKKVTRLHIEYALRHATFDFLLVIWKARQYIPRFNMYIQEITQDPEQPMYLREYKQRRFLEWCAAHP